jgi:hypothetical protein
MGLFFNEFHKKKSLSEKCSVIIYILPFWHKRGQKRFYFCSDFDGGFFSPLSKVSFCHQMA